MCCNGFPRFHCSLLRLAFSGVTVQDIPTIAGFFLSYGKAGEQGSGEHLLQSDYPRAISLSVGIHATLKVVKAHDKSAFHKRTDRTPV